MENEGFWINSKDGACVEIHEHAQFLLNPQEAARFGISAEEHAKKLAGLTYTKERVQILLQGFNWGLIRARGHGQFITFEFNCDNDAALWAVSAAVKNVIKCWESTTLRLNNVNDMTCQELTYGELLEILEKGESLRLIRAIA